MSTPKQNTQFIYVLQMDNDSKELSIQNKDIIKNADGELDCPLDVVLGRYCLGFGDLFHMNVKTINFVEESIGKQREIIRSISFEHLYYNR